MLRKVKSIRFILLLIVIQCQRRGSSVKMKRSTLLDFNFNGGMVKFKEKASEIADSRLVQPLQEVKVGLHVTWLFDSVVEKDRGCVDSADQWRVCQICSNQVLNTAGRYVCLSLCFIKCEVHSDSALAYNLQVTELCVTV